MLPFLVPSALQGSEMCDAEVLEIIPASAPSVSQGCEAEIACFQKYLNGKETSQGGQSTAVTNPISRGPLVLNVPRLRSLSQPDIPFPALSSCLAAAPALVW